MRKLNALKESLTNMKIILNCLSNAWGGRETCFFDDITELKRAGHDVVGITYKDSLLAKKLKEQYSDIPVEEIKTLGFKYFNPCVMRQYYTIIKKHKPQVFHSHDIWSLYSLLLVMRCFKKTPIIATEHLFIEHKKTGLYRRFLYKRLNTMIAISKAMVDNVLGMYPLKPKQVEAIYGGVAYKDAVSQEKALKRTDLNIYNEAFVVGMIGRIDPVKGQMELTQAVNVLLKKYPTKNIFLLIAGRPTLNTPEGVEYEKKLKEFIADNKIRDRVKILGFINSVPEFMSLLDVFVMPSRYEAFGLVLIQAMQAALPVISTDAGSAREMIDHSENGYVYPVGDYKELASALEKIMNDKNRDKLKQHSLRKYNNTFAYEIHLKNLEDLYQRKINELK